MASLVVLGSFLISFATFAGAVTVGVLKNLRQRDANVRAEALADFQTEADLKALREKVTQLELRQRTDGDQ